MSPENVNALASLVYIARRHGLDTSVESLSRRFGNLTDRNISQLLLTAATELGLRGKVMQLSWRDLSKVAKLLPGILELDDGSFAILERFDSGTDSGWVATVVSAGPDGDTTVVVDERQLSSVWSGGLIVLKRSYDLDDEERPFDLGWLTSQVLRERKIFRDISIASLFGTVFAIAPAFITMIVIDRVIVNHSVSTLWVVCGVLAFMIIFEMLLGFLKRLLMQVAATRIDGRLNLYVMERVLRLPMDYFERTPTGLTLGKLYQVGRIRAFLTGQLFGTFLEMITLVGLVPAMFLLNWRLAFFVLFCALMIFLVIFAYLKPLGRLHAVVTRTERDKGAFLTESIYGMRAIKSLALEERRRGEWDVKVAAGINAQYNWGSLANYPQTFVVPFERLIYSGSIAIGAAIALSTPIPVYPGGLIAFAMIASRTANPLIQLARLLTDLGEVRSAVSEVGSVLNEPPENIRAGSGLRLPVYGHVSFSGVNFRYTAAGPLALNNVDFSIQPGAIFGIMGRSGSGKTTITRVLQGLSSNYEGMIKIDGMDLREIDMHHLRTNIGVVPQENFLFSGTVRENISIANPRATMTQIIRAAQLAGAEEFIERMPRGYDTRLEEGASNLSGGQRQRLALARALILEPPILILDEATSALDAESEAIINANLARIAMERTIICVSHRLSMLVPASAILVMEKGRVYDIGRHEELLQRCDIYRHMWYQQNRHTEPSESYDPHLISSPVG